ncbi:MAG TPA: D-alanine--D-alanine ligase [Candidatus Paceibacterota bacterium]|nr:D-alanine--D-alanine ligase [Candidatus Paceibacterota bacterium]
MSLIRVGILRGGIGHEYEVSLKTGASVIKNLPADKYQPVDILITRDGTWHVGGRPVSPEQAIRGVDVVFNALHGEFGEDGQVQQILEAVQSPYTGSRAVASALGMDKHKAKEIFKKAGFKVPNGVVAKRDHQADVEAIAYDAFQKISPPWIVKPVGSGSSVGLHLARTFPELVQALEACFNISDRVLVEEYIKGKEATCGVVENFRNKDHYALLPIEIVTAPNKKLFDYEAKYGGETSEICPGRFTREEKAELERLASEVHKALGLRHYSRSDFIISPRGIYVLEVNSLPGLTEESLIPKSLKSAGIPYDHFLDHIITQALSRH